MFPIYFEVNFGEPDRSLAAAAARMVRRRVSRARRKDVNNNDRKGARKEEHHQVKVALAGERLLCVVSRRLSERVLLW